MVVKTLYSNMVSNHLSTLGFLKYPLSKAVSHFTVGDSVASVLHVAQNTLPGLEAVRLRIQALYMNPLFPF